jgi:nucleotide-binding universal stress UspA family protein
MIEVSRILCPVDFSECSHRALETAVVIARWYNSTLTVFHAYGPPVPPVLDAANPGLGLWTSSAIPLADVREQVTGDLRRFAESVDTESLSVRFEVAGCAPVAGILAVADAWQPDMIVMGTHGRSGFDRLVLGSVTEKILRKVSCAVMTVPPAMPERPSGPPMPFKRILCPIDFSGPSNSACRHALSLAQEADAQLLLMHVVELLPHWDRAPFDFSVYEKVLTAEACGTLQQMIPAQARTWCTPEVLVTKGSAYREILRIAHEQDADVIVMGVHGRNPIDFRVFGSTTHHVIREAHCPVLTLRRSDPGDVGRMEEL